MSEASKQRFWKIEVRNLQKLDFLQIASEATFVCKGSFEAPPSVQNENQIDKS